jgi:hypothetical protein
MSRSVKRQQRRARGIRQRGLLGSVATRGTAAEEQTTLRSRLMSGASPVKGKFQPEGKGYDYASAKAAGMGPTGDGTAENKGHWGSVILASDAVRAKYNLPDESYMVLKGRSHETFFKAVLSEQARGSKIIKLGNRYFSVPKSFSGKGEFKDVFKGMDD